MNFFSALYHREKRHDFRCPKALFHKKANQVVVQSQRERRRNNRNQKYIGCEVLETGYMASAIVLHKVFTTPGVSVLLDTVTIDFALKVKSLAEGTLVPEAIKGLGVSYRYLHFLRRAQKVFRVARKVTQGVAASATLMLTLSSPVAIQQLQTMLREYIYFRVGRLLIYTWETNRLKQKRRLNPILW